MSGITLAHTFVSAKGNGTDLTLIQPSNWNDQHIIKLDANMLLGKLTAGNGPVEQIPLSAFMATLLAAIDAPTLSGLLGIHTTGDGKITLKTAADPGWLMMNDTTFGNVGSTGSQRTNADCLPLFTLLYNNVSDAGAPVFTSGNVLSTRAAQGSAAAAWAALCCIRLPFQLGRAIVGAGAGNGLTNRPLGTFFGEESHALTSGENGPHTHASSLTDNGHVHGVSGGIYGSVAISFNYVGAGAQGGNFGAITINSNTTGITLTNASSGSGTPHNNTQASAAWNVMVKL